MDEMAHFFRKRTAHHEAGHFVVGWFFGFWMESVSIEPVGELYGRVRLDARVLNMAWQPDLPGAPVLRAFALFCLAGCVAEEVFDREPVPWDFWDGGTDSRDYMRAAMALGWDTHGVTDPDEPAYANEEHVEEVRGILKERWQAVEALAHALLERDKTEKWEAVDIIEATGATVVENVVEDFLTALQPPDGEAADG